MEEAAPEAVGVPVVNVELDPPVTLGWPSDASETRELAGAEETETEKVGMEVVIAGADGAEVGNAG